MKDFWNRKDRFCSSVMCLPMLLNRIDRARWMQAVQSPWNSNDKICPRRNRLIDTNWMFPCSCLILLPNGNSVALGHSQYLSLLTPQTLKQTTSINTHSALRSVALPQLHWSWLVTQPLGVRFLPGRHHQEGGWERAFWDREGVTKTYVLNHIKGKQNLCHSEIQRGLPAISNRLPTRLTHSRCWELRLCIPPRLCCEARPFARP